jgi:hypothetical protein
MKAVTFIAYLFFFLLGSGQNFYADTHQSSVVLVSKQNLTENLKIKLAKEDQSITLIEDSETDLEEDFFDGHDNKEKPNTKFFIGKYNLLHTLYSKNFRLFISNNCYNRFNIFSHFSGSSSPIYITQRVLRI